MPTKTKVLRDELKQARPFTYPAREALTAFFEAVKRHLNPGGVVTQKPGGDAVGRLVEPVPMSTERQN